MDTYDTAVVDNPVTAGTDPVLSTPFLVLGGTLPALPGISCRDPWLAMRWYPDARSRHTCAVGRRAARGTRSRRSDRRFRRQPGSALRLRRRTAQPASTRSISRLQHPDLAPLGRASVQGGSRGSG